MRKSVCLAAVAATSLGVYVSVAATDGFFWSTDANVTRTASNAAYWENRTVPGDGGIASFAASPASLTLNNDISGWTLGGLKLNGFSGVVKGNPVALTGDAVVSGSA